MELDNERKEPPKDEELGEDAEDSREDLESIADRGGSPTQADGLDWAVLAVELQNLFKFNADY